MMKRFIKTAPDWFVQCVETRESTKRAYDPGYHMTWGDLKILAAEEDRNLRKRKMQREETVRGSHVQMVQPVSSGSGGATGSDEGRYVGQQESSNPSAYCHYCGRVGHIENDCGLKRHRACFGCNEVGHQFRDCPRNQNKPAVTPKCSSCGGPHLGKDCPSAPSNSFRNRGEHPIAGQVPRAFQRGGAANNPGRSVAGRGRRPPGGPPARTGQGQPAATGANSVQAGNC